jgi:DNA-binding NarL/FixJ family response regulator
MMKLEMGHGYSVAIVGGHLLFANVLGNIIKAFDNFHVSYSVDSGDGFLYKLRNEESMPDIALLDVSVPGTNGVETIHTLSSNYPHLKVLAFTLDEDEDTLSEMLRAGARGCLLKDASFSILHDSLRDVAEKGFYYSDKIRNILFNSLHKKEQSDIILKEREIEFLKQVCTEKTYKEIAEEMFLSPKTIDGYREALFEKLRIKSRVGLAVYAIKHKLYKV